MRVLVFKSKIPKGVMKEMNCDLCRGTNLHELLILRKNRFSKYATKKEKKATRVCWDCGRRLFKSKLYNFGHNWRTIFLDNSVILERNKAKYLVIHA